VGPSARAVVDIEGPTGLDTGAGLTLALLGRQGVQPGQRVTHGLLHLQPVHEWEAALLHEQAGLHHQGPALHG